MNNAIADIQASHAAHEAAMRTVIDELYRLVFVEGETVTGAIETAHRFMPSQVEDLGEQIRAVVQDHDQPTYLRGVPF